MHHTTAALLIAEAALVRFCQAQPTATNAQKQYKRHRSKAVLEWVKAGCPDLPEDGKAKPMEPVKPTPHLQRRSGTFEEVIGEVLRHTERALLLKIDDVRAWLPKSVVSAPTEERDRDNDELVVGEEYIFRIPTDWLKDKGCL